MPSAQLTDQSRLYCCCHNCCHVLQIRTIAIIAEGVPESQTRAIIKAADAKGTTLTYYYHQYYCCSATTSIAAILASAVFNAIATTASTTASNDSSTTTATTSATPTATVLMFSYNCGCMNTHKRAHRTVVYLLACACVWLVC
jgi:hypothetical protein